MLNLISERLSGLGANPICLNKLINKNGQSLNYNATFEFGLRKKSEPVSAIYAFWWLGNSDELKSYSDLILQVKIKGKKTNKTYQEFYSDNSKVKVTKGHIIHTITWDTEWFNSRLPCLYIGKTSNLCSRIGSHLMLKTREWKSNPEYLYKPTSACQFRSGFEHLFQKYPERRKLMLNQVGISFQGFNWNEVAERFYLEDLAIGYFRPWFNIDSER